MVTGGGIREGSGTRPEGWSPATQGALTLPAGQPGPEFPKEAADEQVQKQRAQVPSSVTGTVSRGEQGGCAATEPEEGIGMREDVRFPETCPFLHCTGSPDHRPRAVFQAL